MKFESRTHLNYFNIDQRRTAKFINNKIPIHYFTGTLIIEEN